MMKGKEISEVGESVNECDGRMNGKVYDAKRVEKRVRESDEQRKDSK